MRTQYDEADVKRVIERLAGEIALRFDASRPLGVIGVRTRGETLAQRLAEGLRKRGFSQIERGTLDITLYRDDLNAAAGPRHMLRPTEIPFDTNGKPLLLVDDVLFTGRSARAALNALMDFGRPAVIRFAVLIDRGGRELPIQPDFVGLKLKDVTGEYKVKVRFRENDNEEGIVVEPKS